jgi:hypothetical protein
MAAQNVTYGIYGAASRKIRRNCNDLTIGDKQFATAFAAPGTGIVTSELTSMESMRGRADDPHVLSTT